MLLPEFEFHEPESIPETCQILSEYGLKAKLIAGGTDLMVNMKKKILLPEQVVSVSRIPDLKHLDLSGDQIRIGSGVTVADLAESGTIARYLPALGQGARNLGTPLIRNLATIGGNIGSARPAADLPPGLMAYGADIVLESRSGVRQMSLEDFFLGPGFTDIQPNEILTRIQMRIPPAGSGAAYINIGVRKAQDCNLVNVASYLELDEKGIIRTARIVMGCVGPKPLRANSAEAILTGEKPAIRLFEHAGEAASRDSRPIDDFRSCASYKCNMVNVLTQRTLHQAWESIKNQE